MSAPAGAGPAVLRSTLGGGSDVVTLTSKAGSWWECCRCGETSKVRYAKVGSARRRGSTHACEGAMCPDVFCRDIGTCVCDPVPYAPPGTVTCVDCWAMQTPTHGPGCVECGSAHLTGEWQ